MSNLWLPYEALATEVGKAFSFSYSEAKRMGRTLPRLREMTDKAYPSAVSKGFKGTKAEWYQAVQTKRTLVYGQKPTHRGRLTRGS